MPARHIVFERDSVNREHQLKQPRKEIGLFPKVEEHRTF